MQRTLWLKKLDFYMSVTFGLKTPPSNYYSSSVGCKSCGQFVLSNENAYEFHYQKKRTMYFSCHFLSSFATPKQGYGGVLTKLQLWLSETNEKREGARLC